MTPPSRPQVYIKYTASKLQSINPLPNRHPARPAFSHVAMKHLVLVLCFVIVLQLAGAAKEPKKAGAGLLLCAGGKALLLKRHSKHHDGTWSLPGGNTEEGDGSLLATASREAMEELGQLPPFEIKAQILTKRGKHDGKHFTVFVADVGPGTARDLTPQLSDESREWRWVPWTDVLAAAAGTHVGLDLHPVVAVLASEHAAEVASATDACRQVPPKDLE